MGDTSALGFGHFIANADPVAKVLLVVLALMSAISWYLILMKGVSAVIRNRRSKRFLDFFWSATSLDAVQHELSAHGAREPFGGTLDQLLGGRIDHVPDMRPAQADAGRGVQAFVSPGRNAEQHVVVDCDVVDRTRQDAERVERACGFHDSVHAVLAPGWAIAEDAAERRRADD